MANDPITSLPLGKLLQIAFSKGIRQQISGDFTDFEQVKMARVSGHSPREIRFMFQTGHTPANVQWRKPGQPNRPFPRAFQPELNEYSAIMKEANSSIELESNLYHRAKQSPEKYAEPLQIILNASMVSKKREFARSLYKDGTGVIGQVGAGSAVQTPTPSNALIFTLDQGDASRGHVGDFELADILILRTSAGLATALDVTTTPAAQPVPTYWKVLSRDRKNGKVKLQGLDASFAPVTYTLDTVSVQAAAGSVFYRYDQEANGTVLNLGTFAGDYGSATEQLCGLESLAANDGRLVHGITMSDATGASEYDNGAAALDLDTINAAMDQVKVEVGPGAYTWKKITSAPEVQSALISANEGDRRFQTRDDVRRGSKVMGFQHRQDFLEMVDSEYVHPKRLWILPETKAGEKVIELHGSDWYAVKAPNGDDFQLKVDGGQYVNSMVSFMESTAALICKHPKSVVKIRNFS
jgi:hypothetical protein